MPPTPPPDDTTELNLTQTGSTSNSPVIEKPLSRSLAFEEFVRGGMAYALVALLFITIILGFLGTATHYWANTKAMLQIAIPIETTLLGSAIGYYFGAKKSSS
jgi:hypothetical protein